MSPKDENELRHMLYTGVNLGSPAAVRYPRGNGLGVQFDEKLQTLPVGKAEVVRRGKDALLVCFGPIIANALRAAERLQSELGISCTVINARFAKPLDETLLASELPNYKLVCTVEDHSIAGGFGSAVIEFAQERNIPLQSNIHRFGVGDAFVPHASQAEQYAMNGYDSESIESYIKGQLATARKVA
jgi:1-deoxy-D-xylulose-5-phosphate synthase